MIKAKKKIIICTLLAASVFVLFAGCSMRIGKKNETSLLVFSYGDENTVGAYELEVDLDDYELKLSENPIYQYQKNLEFGTIDRDSIYPLILTESNTVFRAEPYRTLREPYSVLKRAGDYESECPSEDRFTSYKQLWCGDYSMDYIADEDEEKYIIKNLEKEIGSLTAEVKNDERFEPQAFFLDDDENLAMLCIRSKGSAFINMYPVSFVASKDQGGNFNIDKKDSFADIFGEKLSIIHQPHSLGSMENVYADAGSRSFFWNESRNIVRLNPYDGLHDIIVGVKNISRDMPMLDLRTESYYFFWNYGRQNETNILIFPNYNDVAGMLAAFYTDDGEFLGKVLVSEGSAVCFDKDNNEKSRIDVPNLERTLLYAPMQ